MSKPTIHVPSLLAGCFLALLLTCLLRLSGTIHAAEIQWMPKTFEEAASPIEQQLRGFDTTMWEVGYRFVELSNAGQDLNWPLATYQLEKIGHTIKLGIERRPKRAASAQAFLNEVLPEVHVLLKQNDAESFERAMDRLQTGCMQCHVAEQVPFFTVSRPKHRVSPIAPTAALEPDVF